MHNEQQDNLSVKKTNASILHVGNEGQETTHYQSFPQYVNPNPIITQSETGSINGIPGAAFNATPVYDAQGGLVGLQAPMEQYTSGNINPRANQISYLGHQHSTINQFPHSREYIDAMNYHTPHAITGQPSSCQQVQLYESKVPGQDFYQRQLLMEHPALRSTDLKQSTIVRGIPSQPFDTCPTICSLFAIFCCPITLSCSLPALVYSVCAYADYRAADLIRSQRKSEIARHLVIIACVVGLLLCIAWTLLAIFYHDMIFGILADIFHVFKQRANPTNK